MNKENTQTLELKIDTKEVIQSIVDGSFEGELRQALIEAGWTPPWNYDMSKAPKDGTEVLLKVKSSWGEEMVYQGSFGNDQNAPEEEPQWFDNSYDDWSTGYASTPLDPVAWKPIIV